jgi:hypothetical protein
VPASYHINADDELVSLTITGQVTLVDIYELCQRLISDPQFSPHWPQLADLRGVSLDIKPGAMRPFVNYALGTYRTHVAAPVAVIFDGHGEDAFCAGLYRFTCALSVAELFDDYAQGIKWLLANGWRKSGHPAPPEDLLEPPDPRRNGANKDPEHIRT